MIFRLHAISNLKPFQSLCTRTLALLLRIVIALSHRAHQADACSLLMGQPSKTRDRAASQYVHLRMCTPCAHVVIERI